MIPAFGHTDNNLGAFFCLKINKFAIIFSSKSAISFPSFSATFLLFATDDDDDDADDDGSSGDLPLEICLLTLPSAKYLIGALNINWFRGTALLPSAPPNKLCAKRNAAWYLSIRYRSAI